MIDLTKEEAAAVLCMADNSWHCDQCPNITTTQRGFTETSECKTPIEEQRKLVAKLKAYVEAK